MSDGSSTTTTTGTTTTGGTTEGGAQSVPYDRFQTVVTERNTLRDQLAQLRRESQSFSEKAATADTLSKELEGWKAKAEKAEGRYGRYQQITGALGQTDPDVVELVEYQYDKLPADKRPDFKDWLKDLKKDPSKAPSTLRQFLQGVGNGGEVEGGEGEGGDTKTTTTKPRATGGGTQPGGAGGQVTAEQIRKAKEHGVKTGDWSKYKALKKQMGGGT